MKSMYDKRDDVPTPDVDMVKKGSYLGADYFETVFDQLAKQDWTEGYSEDELRDYDHEFIERMVTAYGFSRRDIMDGINAMLQHAVALGIRPTMRHYNDKN